MKKISAFFGLLFLTTGILFAQLPVEIDKLIKDAGLFAQTRKLNNAFLCDNTRIRKISPEGCFSKPLHKKNNTPPKQYSIFRWELYLIKKGTYI